MKHLDLFSGIGGFALAARWCGWETIGFCEIDPYCQKVLRKHWPDVPIHTDVRELDGKSVGPVDVITGGYPCQPFSTAGRRAGQDDDRHLWPEVYRLIREIRPQYALLENVAGHITMGLDDVLSDLEEADYTWEAFVIPACATGAHHWRDRVWIVTSCNDADTDSVGLHRTSIDQHRETESSDGQECEPGQVREILAEQGDSGIGHTKNVAQSHKVRRGGVHQQPGIFQEARKDSTNAAGGGWLNWRGNAHWNAWEVEPNMDRVADGLPTRVDRLRGLGNAIVPQVAYEIMRRIV